MYQMYKNYEKKEKKTKKGGYSIVPMHAIRWLGALGQQE